MKRFDIALIIGLAATILLSSFSGFARECDVVRQSVVRLHILANSDSEADQALKLAVRDAILTGTSDLFHTPQTKEQAEAAAAAHLQEIEALARAELARQGSDYAVAARIVNRFFDTRVYDTFTMPAGRYDAVQVEIGEGAGKNWWCVMFPPMCVPAATEKDDTPLEDQIRELGEPPRYKPAFALVEALEGLRETLNGTDKAETVLIEEE